MAAMIHLFVYGTLKRGCKNHAQLDGQTYLGPARTVPGFQLYDLGDYPGMIVADGELNRPTGTAALAGVSGELWLVTPDALARLDDFEGVDEGLYRREPVGLLAPFDGISAQTYFYNRDPGVRPLGSTWSED